MEEMKVVLGENQKEVIILTGKAAPIHQAENLYIEGSIKAPVSFYEKRKDQFKVEDTTVIVDEDKGVIVLSTGDRWPINKITIVGTLQIHPDFARARINSTDLRPPDAIAKWIKMNRGMFESKAVAMALVEKLRNFKASVSKELEKSVDDRANKRVLIQQIVDSNIPESFEMNVKFFIGEKPQKFLVEVFIDPDSLDCSLISADASDMIREQKADIIAEQLKKFSEFAIIHK